ncbi:MAG: hypothetical protein EOP22_15970 [Hyphomicrobiales bacterium]|nr:MAG: hypothetical protein EOP22_15970 [Hyphomicrobiales bacterium]
MLKALLVALTLAVATPVLAQTVAEKDQQLDSVLGQHDIYATAFKTIQEGLAARDIAAVSGYIGYGEAFKLNGEDVVIADEADLLARFDEIFNAKVVAAVTAQTYETVFVSQDGIMFGNGELWINGICDDAACAFPFVTITAVNNQ